jgi:GBP family porin
MKKTLLAAALLTGFAGAASAQSSVTLYGVVDLGLRYQSVNPGNNFPDAQGRSQFSTSAGQRVASRYGLRGTEDLGNGLSANFVLESAINPADGSGNNAFTRQSSLGVTSKSWGTVEMGRGASAGTSQLSGMDPMILGFGTGSANTALGIAFVRYSNQIQYRTPVMSGFSGAVGYSFNTALDTNAGAAAKPGYEAFSTANKSRATSVGLRYANGPLVLAAAYENVRSASNAVNPDLASKSINAFLLTGNYDFKVVRVFAAFARQTGGFIQGSSTLRSAGTTGGGDTNSASGALFAPGVTDTSWMLGLTAPVGPGLVRFSYQQQQRSGIVGVQQTTLSAPTIAYEYPFSKRTTAYAYYGYEKGVANLSGAKSNSVGLGITHLF